MPAWGDSGTILSYPVPESIQVKSGQEKDDPVILEFKDFFKLPVGPKGLEISDRLLAANGRHVVIQGHMVKMQDPGPGVFMLTNNPVTLGDEDESLSDDLPASVLYVHFDDDGFIFPYIDGMIRLRGVIEIGQRMENDGRISIVRLELDPDIVKDIRTTWNQIKLDR